MNTLKKIFVVLLVIGIPIMLGAQSNPLDSYIDKYEGQDGFFFLKLETNMAGIEGEDDKDSDFNKIINLRMLSYEEGKSTKYEASEICKGFEGQVGKDDYTGIMEVKSSGDDVEMMVRKNGNILSEVIITIREEGEVTLIAASGNFDLKDLAKFNNIEKCKGLEILGKICED